MYNVLLSGACGRMGKEVISALEASQDLKLVCELIEKKI